jgi:hypothetical protein
MLEGSAGQQIIINDGFTASKSGLPDRDGPNLRRGITINNYNGRVTGSSANLDAKLA